MAALEKIPVLNPLTLRNTVGGELADIFEARGIKNFEELIGIKDLRSKEKLSNKALRKAAEVLSDSNVCEYLVNFQKEYLEEKPRYMANYNQAKKTYTKLKKVLPLLRGEFTEGYDILDDILDFFGVDSDTEIFETSEKKLHYSVPKIKLKLTQSICMLGCVVVSLILTLSISLIITKWN